jgi:cytochrome c553
MSKNKQQTAVDLMYQRAISVLPMGSIDARRKLKETYEQSKEMEKTQIKNAWGNERQVVFFDSFEDTLSEDTIKDLAEYYYNETYGGDNG